MRLALASEQPILGAKCPRAQERLFDYSLQVMDRTHIDEEGLEEAAEEVLACQQQELRGRESPLDTDAAFELAEAQHWAIHALTHVHGASGAKRIEMRLTQDAPLAICMGSRRTQPVQTSSFGVLGIPIYGAGCRCVFPDTDRVDSGRLWDDWCVDHKPSKAQLARKRERAHRKVVEQLHADRHRGSIDEHG